MEDDIYDRLLPLTHLGELLVVGNLLKFRPLGQSQEGRVAGQARFQQWIVVNQPRDVR